MKSSPRGFALIAVLGIVLIVSGVALALAGTMRAEVRQATNDRGGLEAEQLCAAGQDMAVYLASRGLGTPLENLQGLPVDVVEPGFHYLVHFPNGDVDLFLDAEDGKLNLSSTPQALLESFFGAWSNDPGKGTALAAVVKDWRDPDDVAETLGAESTVYAEQGFLPRNRGFGVADAALLQGLSPEDFRERLVNRLGSWVRQPALGRFLTGASVGATINPSFAAELVLRSIPGLTAEQVNRVIAERRQRPFRDLADFTARVGIASDAPPMAYFHFVRKVPAVLTVSRSRSGTLVRTERRVAEPFSVEFNYLPEYLGIGSAM